MDRLTEEEVLVIRRRMAQLDIAARGAFGHTEPLHPDKLASAVFRQFTGVGGVYKYTTIEDIAANLFYGVAMSHSFENGNKRTALMAMLSLLEKNRHYLVDTTEDDLYEMAREVANHRFKLARSTERSVESETAGIAAWLKGRLRKRRMGESTMNFVDLKKTLKSLGCTFDKPDRNYIKIHRGPLSISTGYPRARFTVSIQEMKRIRQTLGLNEVKGFDSAAFYDLEQTVDRFVNEYRDLMRRLADL